PKTKQPSGFYSMCRYRYATVPVDRGMESSGGWSHEPVGLRLGHRPAPEYAPSWLQKAARDLYYQAIGHLLVARWKHVRIYRRHRPRAHQAQHPDQDLVRLWPRLQLSPTAGPWCLRRHRRYAHLHGQLY